ncbi:MAG: hypothetical protein M5U01_15320 [Ardenticatenaceae bacterium]|nr:hypothetical protein [Ardenticatenaceae bacterium]HBY96050.1 hypothetical protein [Chloroflexota bacterium]
MTRKSIELARVTHATLEFSNVRDEEWVVVYSDTSRDPDLVDAFFAAAHALAGEATLLLRTPQPVLAEPRDSIRDLLKAANMVVDLASNPWLYTYALNAIIDSGTRVLQVNPSAASLNRLPPAEWKIRRAEAGAALFTAADDIELTSAAGTHLRMRAAGRPGWGQDGVVRRPGDWDNAGTSILAVAPLEDAVDGILVVEPGDTIATRPRRARAHDAMRLTIEGGRITGIDGGYEAHLFREWLAQWNDPGSYVVAHTGFGADPRATVDDPGEWESIEGGINIAFGSNLFRGLAGRNHARSHLDIVVLKHSMKISGETVVDAGRLIEPTITQAAPNAT